MKASCRSDDFRCSTHWKDISMALSPNSEPHHSNSCPWKLKLWKTNSNLLDNTDVGSDVSHGMSSLEVFMKKTCQNCFFFEMPPSQNKTLQHSICRPMAAVPGRTGQAQNLLAQWFPLTSCPELNGGPALGNGYCRASMTFDNDATLTPFLLDMFFPCVHLLRHVTHLYRNLAWWNGTTHPYQRETPWDLAFCQLTYRAGGGLYDEPASC